MVHTGLARGVARSTDPVSGGGISDGTSGTDGVAFSFVAVEAISTVVAYKVLGAFQTS